MHIPVLLDESIENLSIHTGDTVVDGTFGGGGHSSEIVRRFGKTVKLIATDLDEAAKDRFEANPLLADATFVHANFKDVSHILEKAEVTAVDRVLLDLGTSTFQLLEDTRGFSFHSDAPLHMSFSNNGSHTGFSAATIINEWEEESIADIIFYYGEEKQARRIAKAIVMRRNAKPIKSAKELASVIELVVKRRGKLHPATKTFQALRIAVNDELQVITEALEGWLPVLSSGGRIAVITFHSLEDRIVKRWMLSKNDVGRVITKKPITPSLSELKLNPRARSAKLRVYEKR